MVQKARDQLVVTPYYLTNPFSRHKKNLNVLFHRINLQNTIIYYTIPDIYTMPKNSPVAKITNNFYKMINICNK